MGLPIGADLQQLQRCIFRQRAVAIRIEAPTVLRITMLRAARWREQEDVAARLEHAHHLQPRAPEILHMLERLTRDDHIDREAVERQAIGRLQHHIHVRARTQIHSDVLPLRVQKELLVAAVDVVAADVDDLERLVGAARKVGVDQALYVVQRTLVHAASLLRLADHVGILVVPEMLRSKLQQLRAGQMLGHASAHIGFRREGRAVFLRVDGVGFAGCSEVVALCIERHIGTAHGFRTVGGEHQHAAGRHHVVDALEPARPGRCGQVAEERQHKNRVMLLVPLHLFGHGGGHKGLHTERLAGELHGVSHHIGRHHTARTQRLHQMTREAAMAACELQKAARAQKRMIHLFEQQHQLGHGAPAISQIVADGVQAGGVRGKELVDVVRLGNLARAAHPLTIRQQWEMRLDQVVRGQTCGRHITRLHQQLPGLFHLAALHQGLRLSNHIGRNRRVFRRHHPSQNSVKPARRAGKSHQVHSCGRRTSPGMSVGETKRKCW
ncbi:hypothetical protein SDC9_114926 [bioreactor metagenome]|uniref:Uncharacterized protein n=1 Tax=bioreactor metagenome TaxID=1076179 RepID=A0A645BRE3_9ZZZZ